MTTNIDGVRIRRLEPHHDDRGVLTELYRDAWHEKRRPIQWNAVSSRANVLRGVHCHVRHSDLVTVVSGSMVLGLHDLRPWSPTFGTAVTMSIPALSAAVEIEPGVAHGFYFAEPSVHVYAVSDYWNQADELGCRWDDPETALDWPTSDPLVSERDAAAGAFSAMREAVGAALATA